MGLAVLWGGEDQQVLGVVDTRGSRGDRRICGVAVAFSWATASAWSIGSVCVSVGRTSASSWTNCASIRRIPR